MSADGDAPATHGTRRALASAGRVAVSSVVGGVTAAIVFLVMVQGSFRKGYTDLDFNHVFGTMIRGGATEAETTSALGVVGDTAGPTGLYATLICGAVLVLIHALVLTRLVRRHWTIQALPLALVTFLAIGLIYCPVADYKFDTPMGLFGIDAGGMTPVVLALSSLGFAMVGSRIHSLAVDASWWERREESLEEVLQEVSGGSLLELPEEGREQRGVDA